MKIDRILRSLFRWLIISPKAIATNTLLVIIGFCFLLTVAFCTHLYYSLRDPRALQRASTEAPFFRAPILDRHGAIVAKSLLFETLYIDRQQFQRARVSAEKTAQRVLTIIPELNQERLVHRLTLNPKQSGVSRIARLAKKLSPSQAEAIHKLGIPSLFTRPEYERVYPYSEIFAHVVGYVDDGATARAGVELTFDDALKRQHHSIVLSIDQRIQSGVYYLLSQAVRQTQAQSGVVIVSDVQTGEILALLSYPSFDPNNIGQSSEFQRRNRATHDLHEPGSTLKMLTFAAALQDQILDLDDIIPTVAPLRVDTFSISDLYPYPQNLSAADVFIKSSNKGAARIALKTGEKRQQEWLERFALTQPTKIEIGHAAPPLRPFRSANSHVATLGYGHGIALTGLHVLQLGVAVSTGLLRQPTVIRQKLSQRYPNATRVLSDDVSAQMRWLLAQAVSDGTGKAARTQHLTIGGKTGTAEIAHKGAYDQSQIRASFFGVAPAANPRIALYVLIDQPLIPLTGDRVGGGTIAAPLAADILEYVFSLQLNIQEPITAQARANAPLP